MAKKIVVNVIPEETRIHGMKMRARAVICVVLMVLSAILQEMA